MNHPKSKDILIYHSENMFVEHVDNRIEGVFNRIHWHDLNKINDAIISLISNVSGKAESVPYISVDSENRSHIGYRISILLCDIDLDFQLLILNFLSEIIKIDNQSGDLFNQNLTIYDQIIKKEAHHFLLQNGNKPIRQVLEIKTENSLIKMSGRFGKVPTMEQDLDDPPEVHSAVVDGLVRHHRNVHLKLTSQKIIVAYFNQSDFLQLHGLMLSNEIHQFTIQNKLDAGGKKDLCLISIKAEPENFFKI